MLWACYCSGLFQPTKYLSSSTTGVGGGVSPAFRFPPPGSTLPLEKPGWHACVPAQITQSFPEGNGTLPEVLYRLLDPAAQVELPPPGAVRLTPSDNRELDKLVAALGRNKATWRRALMLHEWLLKIGHRPDDR